MKRFISYALAIIGSMTSILMAPSAFATERYSEAMQSLRPIFAHQAPTYGAESAKFDAQLCMMASSSDSGEGVRSDLISSGHGFVLSSVEDVSSTYELDTIEA